MNKMNLITIEGFHPCKNCGSKPQIITVGYGRKCDDVRCSNPACGQYISVDYTVKECRKQWNAANPLPALPTKSEYP
jgi:hypothetical protein